MTRLDRITYYADPVDRWASITEFSLRRQAYIRHEEAEALRLDWLEKHGNETRTALLAFEGAPIELQDEASAAFMVVRRRAMVDRPGPQGES